ncbi:MAG: hypothetical protein K5840_03890 [Eubacterium sp.]|nr:hypothetical protein [Eubacterium sp.]
MGTLYIHIGTPKTGTTAIQLFMSGNEEALKAQNTIYPRLGKKGHLVRVERNGHWLCDVEDSEGNIKANTKLINDLCNEYENVVLSDEGVWNYSARNPEFWHVVEREFSKYDFDYKVVVYLRRQDDYAYSHYLQQIQTRNKYKFTLKKYLDGCITGEKNWNDYFAYLDNLSSIIGKDRIIVRPYERSEFRNGSIIQDFFDVIGIEMTDDFKEQKAEYNPSIKDVIVEAKRCLNTVPLYGQSDKSVSEWLIQIQNELKDEHKLKNRSGFVKEKRMKFLSNFEEGNDYVARVYLGREDGMLFRNYEVKNDDSEAAFRIAEIRDVYTRLTLINDDPERQRFDPPDWKQITDEALQYYINEHSLKTRAERYLKRQKKKLKKKLKKLKSTIK